MFRPDELLIVITLLFPTGSGLAVDQQVRIELRVTIPGRVDSVTRSPMVPYRFPAPRKPDCR
jgi:hypothetical protein